MSSIYFESELKEQKKYEVQNLKRLGDASKFIGLTFTFNYVVGTMAHGRITNTMQAIPIRSVAYIPGYIADGARNKTADGFVVIFKNDEHPVGRGYLGPTKVTDTHAFFDMNGLETSVPLSILSPIRRVREKQPKEVIKASKASGVSLSMISALDEPSAREDIIAVPALIGKLFPNLTITEITSVLYEEDTGEEYFDMSGESHKTVVEVDKANAILRHKMYEAKIIKLVEMHVRNEMKVSRKDALAKRKNN